ncbi:MAG: methyltransferase domain-containing protein [Chloroflexota bacterium]|nr:methyltransferase domain-containing protein [Chloroflexota bacterium]
METRRVSPHQGYDLWSDTYDATPNPVVRLDQRVTPEMIRSRPAQRILDAGCGTGRYFPSLMAAGGQVVGTDFSLGMLRVARAKHPAVPLVAADLQAPWPFRDNAFDAVLCALVGEHLDRLPAVCAEMCRVLAPRGRAVFSVYHAAMAAAGKEANFRKGDVEYRLGAERYAVQDYSGAFEQAGFAKITVQEFRGDDQLAAEVPSARKYVGFPMLLVYEAIKPS